MSRKFETIFYGDVINCVKDENGKEYNLQEMIAILNEQSERIKSLEMELDLIANTKLFSRRKLEEENEKLRKELDNFKPVMFQDVRKGTVILYSKGDIDE